jgi:hypothetical protein
MKRLRVEPFGIFIKPDHLAPQVDAISRRRIRDSAGQ